MTQHNTKVLHEEIEHKKDWREVVVGILDMYTPENSTGPASINTTEGAALTQFYVSQKVKIKKY